MLLPLPLGKKQPDRRAWPEKRSVFPVRPVEAVWQEEDKRHPVFDACRDTAGPDAITGYIVTGPVGSGCVVLLRLAALPGR